MNESELFLDEYVCKPIAHSVEVNLAMSLAKLKCASFNQFTNEHGAGFRFFFRDESVMIADAFGFRQEV